MKISAYSIILLGLAIGLVVLSYGWFQHWIPNKTEAVYQREYVQQLKDQIALSPKAEKRLHDAEVERDKKAAAWQKFVAVDTPPSTLPNGINLSVDPWKLMMDARVYRNSAQRQLNAQLRIGGVKVIAGPEIPWPAPTDSNLLATYFNESEFSYPIVIWELGPVRVQGTYKQICDNVRAWSRMKGYLAVVDGLQISGTSGTSGPLDGTYNLVMVGFLKGKTFFGNVNEGAAPASRTTGAGGAGMMGPGAMPGGPGGGRMGVAGGPTAGGPMGGPMGGPGGGLRAPVSTGVSKG
jgi:hypothetical protein